MPGPPPEVTTKRCLPRRNSDGPLGEQLREAARVLVVAGHLDGGHGALALQVRGRAGGDLRRAGRLLVAGRGLAGAGVIQQFERVIGLLAAAKARRAEEDHRVLNLFVAEARQRLKILGDDADQASVGAVQEMRSSHRPEERARAEAAHRCREWWLPELFPGGCSLYPCSLSSMAHPSRWRRTS